jgi:hypothetical protein
MLFLGLQCATTAVRRAEEPLLQALLTCSNGPILCGGRCFRQPHFVCNQGWFLARAPA